MKKNVVLGVTGGIAAIKISKIIQKLLEKGIDIDVILSPGAQALIEKSEIEKKINKSVYTSLFSEKVNVEEVLKKKQVEHIELAGKADVIVIAPATANIIAKLACGIADDYITTVALAATCPIVVCPSMNVHMWHHPATQKNVQTLRFLGYIVIEPDSGMLACGYEGQGRLAEAGVITDEVMRLLSRSDVLKGKKVIVTAGGTREAVDDVRFITNRSSGKMGCAIAESLYLLGATVTFVRAKSAVPPRYNLQQIEFETADDLNTILEKEAKTADYLFHAAAVSDFSISKSSGKISSHSSVSLSLIPQKKIINNVKKWNPKIILIAFKAEANLPEKELVALAIEKLRSADADFVVANDIGKKDRGFEVDTNEVFVIGKDKQITKLPLASKKEIAEKIIESILTI